jgi:sugar phosphate permease
MMANSASLRGKLRQASWVVWGVGVGVYFLAVFHRSSLGVAGPQAMERLDLSAGQLSTFVMLQLGVYAAMQVPTGILVDRFGPRRMLLAATIIMGSAQLLFSQVQSYPLALLARGLLGCGDAMTYISVLRLVAGWFPARRYPVMVTITSVVGMAGNVIATVPLTFMLADLGWGPTFAIAGGLSLAYGLLLLRPAARAPFREAESKTGPMGGRRVLQEVKTAWRLPAGRLGFWIHMSTMAGPTVFAVLWGYPYLTQGLGYAPGQASSLLLLLVIGGLIGNLLLGPVLVRRPHLRGGIAISVASLCLLGWLTLILWPGGQPPVWVVVIIVCVFSIGGPASGIGFMLARDYNPRHRISTATGLVNVGGFCGAVVVVFAVGQILDWLEPGAAVHSLTAYRWALVAIAVMTAFGIFRVATWLLRTRVGVLRAAARGEDVPVEIVAHRWDLLETGEFQIIRGTPEGEPPRLAAKERDASANGQSAAENGPTPDRTTPDQKSSQ